MRRSCHSKLSPIDSMIHPGHWAQKASIPISSSMRDHQRSDRSRKSMCTPVQGRSSRGWSSHSRGSPARERSRVSAAMRRILMGPSSAMTSRTPSPRHLRSSPSSRTAENASAGSNSSQGPNHDAPSIVWVSYAVLVKREAGSTPAAQSVPRVPSGDQMAVHPGQVLSTSALISRGR